MAFSAAGLVAVVELRGRAGSAGPVRAGSAGSSPGVTMGERAESEPLRAGSVGGRAPVVRPGEDAEVASPTEEASPAPLTLRGGGVGGADVSCGMGALGAIGRGARMTGGERFCAAAAPLMLPRSDLTASGDPVGESKGLACPALSTPGELVGESNGFVEAIGRGRASVAAVTCCSAADTSVALLPLGGGTGGFGDTGRTGEGGALGVVGRDEGAAPNFAAREATDTGPEPWSSGSADGGISPKPSALSLRDGVFGRDPAALPTLLLVPPRGGGTGGGLLLLFLNGLAGGVIPPLLP